MDMRAFEGMPYRIKSSEIDEDLGVQVASVEFDGEDYGMGAGWREVQCAFTVQGSYIGTCAAARTLIAHGIEPELADPEDYVCTVGWDKGRGGWWGWTTGHELEFFPVRASEERFEEVKQKVRGDAADWARVPR